MIAPFRPAESVAYLLAVTGEQDAAAAAALAGELGHLPLALAQAGAYIARSGLTTLAGYLGRYRSARLLNNSKVRGYKETVATTWAVSFAAVDQQAPAARDFMRFCAFLAPDAIPVEIFELGGEALPPGLRALAEDPDELDRVISLLRQYSLLSIEPQSRTLSVHRLVQEAVRDGLGDEWPAWARTTVTVLTALFPEATDEPAAWPRCRQYLAHAEVSLSHLREHELAEDRSSDLRNRLGLYLREVGSYEPAYSHLARSLQIRSTVCGQDHPDVAWCHTYLCRTLQSLGRYEEALEQGGRAVAIWQARGADDRPALATGHHVLGHLLYALGRFDQALEQQEMALRIRQDQLGPEHPATAAIHDSLGVTLRALEQYSEALTHQQRALAIRQKCLRPDHPAIGVSYNNLALALKALGRLEEALEAQRMAMVIVEQVLPADHPHVAASHNNISTILQNLGRYGEALDHQQQALNIVQKAYPSVHPHVATSHHNLGIVLRLMERYEEALEHHRKALAIREKLYPPFHRNIGVSHRHLGYVLRALGRHDEAEHHFLRMNRGLQR